MAMDATTLIVCGLLLVTSALSTVSTATTTASTTLNTTLDNNGTADMNETTSSPPPSTITTAVTSTTPSTSIIPTTSVTINPKSCQVMPCQNNGTCDDVTGQCNCTSDYSGTYCDTQTYCPADYCDQTGTHNCTVVAKDMFMCHCMPNATGMYCDTQTYCPADYCDQTGTHNCTVMAKDMFLCHCMPNATGVNCSEENVCYMNPCKNGGICHLDKSTAGYHCNCTTGSLDQQQNCMLNDVKDCIKHIPDQNNYITCMDTIGGYHMVCKIGFGGAGCKTPQTLAEQCDRYNNTCTDEGFCKPTCNQTQCQTTSNCKFGVTPVFNKSICEKNFANGYEEAECTDEENLFDGFDKYRINVSDCSPFFWTVCMEKFNNGHCDQQCNNSQCMFDGGDCLERSTNASTYLPGSVVIDYKTEPDEKKTHTKLSLLTRSNLAVQLKPPGLQLMLYDDHFQSVERFGQFLSAALAKLPCFNDACVTTSVTDVFVCEENHYVNDARTACLETCSSHCKGVPGSNLTCSPANGQCIHYCQIGFGGPRCDFPCIDHCDSCVARTSCISCRPGWYPVNNVCQSCPVGCSTTCDMTGKCTGTCKHGYYGEKCEITCPNCKNKCQKDGKCDLGCIDGWSSDRCERPCPGNCDVCDQMSQHCKSACKPGFTGLFCNDHTSKTKMDRQTSGNNTAVIVAILISLIIIALVVILCLCYWRKHQSGEYSTRDNEEFAAVEAEPKQTEPAPSSPLVTAESHDMIDMDEMKVTTAVYAGPNRSDDDKDVPQQNSVEENVVVIQPDVTIEPSTEPSGSLPSVKMIDETDDEADKVPEEAEPGKKPDEEDADKKSEPPKSPSEPTSPKEPIGRRTSFKTQVSITVQKDGTMEFESPDADGPPKSPLSQTLAPLASEEDLLASIGPPKVPDNSPPESDAEKISQKSKSRSSSSSSSSDDEKKKKTETSTEM